MNSLSHYNLVHKFIPLPQAMKIPDAKAAVDKECEKLGKIGVPGRTVGVEGKGVGNRRLRGMTRVVAPVNPGEPQGVLVGDERPGGRAWLWRSADNSSS